MPRDRLIGEDYCLNCNELLTENAWYCHQCGQKCTDGRISIVELFREFFEAVFDIDSRFFKTLRHLFIPGKLTNEYFIGRRKKYVHPLRLFLVTGIIFFTLTSIVVSRYADHNLMRAADSVFREHAFQLQFIAKLDTIRSELVDSFEQSAIVEAAYDSLFFRYEKTKGEDSIDLSYFYLNENWEFEGEEANIAKVDMQLLNDTEIIEKYEVKGFLGKLIVQQSVRVLTHLEKAADSVISQLIWTFLFTLILLGFGLKLLYIRRRLFYVEHLIFSFHFHGFAFLITSFFIFLYWLFPSFAESISGFLSVSVSVIIYLYLFIAMKLVYRQGWFKTIIKFMILNFMYIFLFTFALVVGIFLTYLFY